MVEFFKHFPPERPEALAIKMMKCKLRKACEKHERNDESYIEDLEKLKDMLEVFLKEKS